MDVDFQSWLLRSSFSLRICATSIVGASKGRSYLSQIHHVINNFCAIVVCSGKFWSILWAKRVKITLAEKGIKYESMKQNLIDKSPLLLEMNPQFDLKLTGVYKPKKLSCLKCELMTLLYCRTADYQALFRFDDHRSKQSIIDSFHIVKTSVTNVKKAFAAKREHLIYVKKLLIKGRMYTGHK
ncbi:hypothetical protein NC652_012371 [Populus alba x Populus x berolinensis]|nr:hypothetical protein NC652_012371 [Populus alba x Populus x berolinensis]